MDVNDAAPKSKLPLILFAIFGGGAVLVVALIGILGFSGWRAFQEQAETALNGNAVIQEHIGTIESLDIDLAETGDSDDENAFVYRVKGTRGSGVVTARLVTIDADTEELVGGNLQLSDGRVFPLFTED